MSEPVSIGRSVPEPWQPVDGEPMPFADSVVDLHALSAALLEQARADARGKASAVVVKGEHQRAVLMALCSGNGLGEHSSPPAATLHCLVGSVRLWSPEESWTVLAGSLVPIPEARHGVDAVEDSVFLLTVTPPGRS